MIYQEKSSKPSKKIILVFFQTILDHGKIRRAEKILKARKHWLTTMSVKKTRDKKISYVTLNAKSLTKYQQNNIQQANNTNLKR